MTKLQCIALFLWICVSPIILLAEETNDPPRELKEQLTTVRYDCALATQQIDLAVNNVRATLLNGGDMWWDRRNGGYIVPNVNPSSGGDGVSALYAGGIWMGGFDPGGSLKLAAQSYGSNFGSTDFWPGPLTVVGQTESKTCENWDRFFKVTALEIQEHLRRFESAQQGGVPYTEADIPDGVKGWPGGGNPHFQSVYGFELPDTYQGLAPYFDIDGDGVYNPLLGDYPTMSAKGCDISITPDEMIFWIINDAGGIHSESQADPIQMEVQNLAFAYATNDANNNHTFYRHKLINRAIESIDDFYFSYWVDPDLGCEEDDFIGSHPERNLAYVYNQDALDGEGASVDCGGIATYGDDIPAVGIDFLDGLVDEQGEPTGFTSFMYYNRSDIAPPGTGDPNIGIEFYRYMTGRWQDGTPLTRGGNGYNPGSTDRVFHAFSDNPNDAQGWSMCSEAAFAGDRRFIMSTGGGRLDPGAVDETVTAVVWTPTLDYPCPDIQPLFEADDQAQALFDNCFQLLEGPDAPDLIWDERDRELKVTLVNNLGSNNYDEAYAEVDITAPSSVPEADRTYLFEGYRLYQVVDANVNMTDLDDLSKARLIASVDLSNGIGELINWSPPVAGSGSTWIGRNKNPGATDGGIIRSFTIEEDLFATGDPTLVNRQTYHFMVVAYAYNSYEDFSQTNGVISGQESPYLQGRRNVRVYSVSPQKGSPIGSTDDIEVMRLDGVGANANFLRLSDGEREKIFDGTYDGTITYEGGFAPIDIFIKDPDLAKNGEYLVRFYVDPADPDNYRYKVFEPGQTDTLFSDNNIEQYYEQTTPFGFNIGIGQTPYPGVLDQTDQRCGTVGSEVITSGDSWLSAVKDDKGESIFDFVKPETNNFSEAACLDVYTNLAGGLFTPFILTDYQPDFNTNQVITPALTDPVFDIVRTRHPMDSLNNVDIVLTSDKSKWSRCIVVETASPLHYGPTGTGLDIPTIGDAENLYLRKSRSVTKEAIPGQDFAAVEEADPDDFGMGWFPGYAVDVETGQRLNIFFGENSIYNGQTEPQAFSRITGDNMIWDPTSERTINSSQGTLFNSYAGGQHFVYVTKQSYDGCASLRARMDEIPFRKVRSLQQITWVGLPILEPGKELLSYAAGLIPSETVIRLRVQSPYQNRFGTGQNNSLPEYLVRLGEDVISGLQDLESTTELKVSPNPFLVQGSDRLIQLEGVSKGSQLSLYSLNGRLITQASENQLNYSKQILQWEMGSEVIPRLRPGIYFIQIESPQGERSTLKWVVM